ncbi:uncharacterized protein I206_106437 [Kwoniella pini CBS 10737]|uniref:TIGR02453 family protein n=1 Tax=Kwoniella pini CBS 10737 TaxID=1296096 RepID=A0A1B9HUB1_9TREE|nr:uncharacterized protein I206_07241 [Kwoniella pini CBS 10737]OCF46854.1 hypothetical protein I206_07241 [Kwoniella pini CBS 10737]
MVKAKTTPTQPKARASPRISAASAKSTPTRSSKQASTSTPLKSSISSTPTKGKWIEKSAKTSPYFPKSKTTSKPAQKSKGKAKILAKDEDEEREHSPSGLTESEQSSTDDEGSEDDFIAFGESELDEPIEEDSDEDGSVDSDFIDEGNSKKRKSTSNSRNKSSVKKAKITKLTNGKQSTTRIEGYEDEDEDDDEEIELEEGQEIAGRIYPAPKSGQVPPGMISQNTLNFLKNLQIPERNDREWFRSHEPAFRQAENEWKAFVGIVQMKFHEADDEIPILPSKDIIHRIYRDVRFSSDKTPYKRNFSMSTSRGGRKGIWAAYHLSISPNNKSLLACGIWQPFKNELSLIRQNLLKNPKKFRKCISDIEFIKLFGEPKEDKKTGKRQNVFGNDDALKVAPKGIEKDHKDIDLLKLRSIAVVHYFKDEQVIAKDFQEQLYDVLVVMRPFVRLLNEYVTLPPDNDNNEEDADEDEHEDQGEED